MIITGIEVIRGNPGTLAAQIDPGFLVEAVPPEKLELTYGDKLRITTGFDYRGPAHDITLYGSIGQRKAIIGFDEIISAEATYKLPSSPTTFTPVKASVDIPITADAAPKPDYDIYCKIKEYPGAGLPQVDDVITISGIPPTFELLEETIYPYAYVYDGPCDVSTFTFKSDPFTPTSWIAGKLTATVEAEVEKGGGRVLEMRVYVDKSPLLWTDWRIEVVGISPTTTAGLAMSLGIAWWAIAILAALAIILIIVITWSIKTIMSSFTHKPISEEVKAAWSKETLIKVIGDFETKLKRTPTPPEELEKKTDQELRDYCNELAKAIAPPAEGLGLAIAAAGVLGLGALALGAYAMSRPRETEK
jgi:hypothetical protein